MQFKIGDKIRFIKKVKMDERHFIPANTIWRVSQITKQGDYVLECPSGEVALVGGRFVDECCEIKPAKDKHNILADLVQSDGSIDGEKLMEKLESQNKKDAIHPDYYKFHGYDVFDMANYFGLSFPLGNGLKYLLRAGKKDKNKTIQDLEKCVECVQREIKFLKEK